SVSVDSRIGHHDPRGNHIVARHLVAHPETGFFHKSRKSPQGARQRRYPSPVDGRGEAFGRKPEMENIPAYLHMAYLQAVKPPPGDFRDFQMPTEWDDAGSL